jgi:putative iron-only hydrogenase system regulator
VEKRIGIISIIIERHVASVSTVNALLEEFSDMIIGRLGLPYPDRGVGIITLVTDSSVEQLSALTGKLGKLPGLQVRSMMAKPRQTGATQHDPPEQ